MNAINREMDTAQQRMIQSPGDGADMRAEAFQDGGE